MEKPNKCTEKNKENNSAPVEILTEFLSSIMLHDYETALRHCSQSKLRRLITYNLMVLTHEPENSTAKEFYPLILKKLEIDRNEELENSSDSDDSTYSASDSSSFNHDTDNMNSSSNSSLTEVDDKQSSESKTEQEHFKKEVIFPSTSQNKKKILKASWKKELHKPPYPSARALSITGSTYGTSTIEGDEKPKLNYQEFSSLKTGMEKIENLGHLPKNGILERRIFTNRDSQEEKVLIIH